ncbi:RmlC-like cupin domain-containing protein [Naematelia encephala]|uniref:RmlC-like cupin domain-containing protein n=1 Tax=Naematelia encephala TaxID=71784 RepID=A0A1Y2AQC7_9TREE|nr:RmlC-like cupin domain-containing protein [Naematelia encephala]
MKPNGEFCHSLLDLTYSDGLLDKNMTRPVSLSSLKVTKHHIPAYGSFPNTSLQHHPLLIYHGCFPSSVTASSVEAHLTSTGVVAPAWRFPMYRQHHYHSTTHEVLVVTSGAARLCFGGGGNPGKVEQQVDQGDVMVVPAGVAHAMIEDHGGFQMVGSYPVGGEQWDMCTGEEGEKGEAWKRIQKLRWFDRDPVYGDQGPTISA